MTEESDLVCLGVDWSESTEPCLRMAKLGSPDPSFLVPLNGSLKFRADGSEGRYCVGWFDLTGAEPRHVNCPTWEKISRGKQCQRCQYREGFIMAHQAHREPNQLPDNVRDYMTQRHWLYLDMFADGSSKVGTVAESRLSSRLAEQGAVAAYYVANADDGVEIRKAEAAVSSRFNLRQALSTKRKLEALQAKVEVGRLQDQLSELVEKVLPFLSSLAATDGWISPLETPRAWKLPSTAMLAFSSTPVIPYPNELNSGEHSLYIRAVTGPFAVFAATDDEPDPMLYVGDLSTLHGVPLRFGDFKSNVASVQTSLF
jgi:Protein of unknown function (DUF2797)